METGILATFTEKINGVTLVATVQRQNQDLLIQLVGGDVPHFGVVTVVATDGSIQDLTTASRPGHVHQETVLTHQLAAQLRPHLQANAMIVSGVHVNRITSEQMRALPAMVVQLGRQLIEWISNHQVTKEPEIFN